MPPVPIPNAARGEWATARRGDSEVAPRGRPRPEVAAALESVRLGATRLPAGARQWLRLMSSCDATTVWDLSDVAVLRRGARLVAASEAEPTAALLTAIERIERRLLAHRADRLTARIEFADPPADSAGAGGDELDAMRRRMGG